MCNAACLQYCIVKEDICNQIFGDNFDFDENSNDKNDEDDSLCDWQAIVYCWWQCRQDSDWNWDRAEHRRWQIVLSHLVLFLLLILFHMLLLLQGKVCRRSASMRNSRYVMWTHNFLTHLYISRRVLLKTKVFLRQKLPPDFISKRRIHWTKRPSWIILQLTVFKKLGKKTFCPLVWGLRIKS